MTIPGYPFKFVESDLSLPRIFGVVTFILGIISLSTLISLSGWTKSKITGIITTVVGDLTLLILIIMF